MMQGSICSELLMCHGGVPSILLLPLVASSLKTIDVCLGILCCVYGGCVDCDVCTVVCV